MIIYDEKKVIMKTRIFVMFTEMNLIYFRVMASCITALGAALQDTPLLPAQCATVALRGLRAAPRAALGVLQALLREGFASPWLAALKADSHHQFLTCRESLQLLQLSHIAPSHSSHITPPHPSHDTQSHLLTRDMVSVLLPDYVQDYAHVERIFDEPRDLSYTLLMMCCSNRQNLRPPTVSCSPIIIPTEGCVFNLPEWENLPAKEKTVMALADLERVYVVTSLAADFDKIDFLTLPPGPTIADDLDSLPKIFQTSKLKQDSLLFPPLNEAKYHTNVKLTLNKKAIEEVCTRMLNLISKVLNSDICLGPKEDRSPSLIIKCAHAIYALIGHHYHAKLAELLQKLLCEFCVILAGRISVAGGSSLCPLVRGYVRVLTQPVYVDAQRAAVNGSVAAVYAGTTLRLLGALQEQFSSGASKLRTAALKLHSLPPGREGEMGSDSSGEDSDEEGVSFGGAPAQEDSKDSYCVDSAPGSQLGPLGSSERVMVAIAEFLAAHYGFCLAFELKKDLALLDDAMALPVIGSACVDDAASISESVAHDLQEMAQTYAQPRYTSRKPGLSEHFIACSPLLNVACKASHAMLGVAGPCEDVAEAAMQSHAAVFSHAWHLPAVGGSFLRLMQRIVQDWLWKDSDMVNAVVQTLLYVGAKCAEGKYGEKMMCMAADLNIRLSMAFPLGKQWPDNAYTPNTVHFLSNCFHRVRLLAALNCHHEFVTMSTPPALAAPPGYGNPLYDEPDTYAAALHGWGGAPSHPNPAPPIGWRQGCAVMALPVRQQQEAFARLRQAAEKALAVHSEEDSVPEEFVPDELSNRLEFFVRSLWIFD